eukprot:UN01085
MADEEYDAQQPQIDESAIIKEINDGVAEVRAILSQQPAVALRRACELFPINVKNEEAKQKVVDLFITLFGVVPATEAIVQALPDSESRTNLLKYSYKVMATAQDKKVCDNALLYNGFVTKIEGPGAINRAITARNM